jgi:hypothetical protein
MSSSFFGLRRMTALVTLGGGLNAFGGTEKQYSTL